MYHALVRRGARVGFERVSRGDAAPLLRIIAPNVHHVFAGDHALGGERHSRDALGRWFGRLFRLFPGLRLDVEEVASAGWPWKTIVTVEWRAHATLQDGSRYSNTGAHVIRLRWGKAVYIHAYEDSQRVADACRRLAAAGVEEASAPPITN
jgi:ketosteroid isomerase-like protein